MEKLYVYVDGKKIPILMECLGDNIRIKSPYNKSLVEEIKALDRPPNSWESDTKTWLIKNNRRNLFALDILSNGPFIERYDKSILNVYGQHLSLDDQDFSRNYGSLWTHQIDMFNFAFTRRRCIFAAEMRTGKTFPALAVLHFKNITEIGWWVAPKRALEGVKREHKKWFPELNIEFRTYDSLRSILDIGLQQIPQFVVFDECQKLKTPNSLQTQAAQYLSDLMFKKYDGEEFLIGLSGTPSPKNPGDWWSICEVIQPGFIKESSRAAFERRLGVFEQREGGIGQMYWHLIEWKQTEVEYLYKRLKPLVQVHLKKDCLDLPDKQYRIVNLKPSRMLLRVAKTIADNEENVLNTINRLRQLSDGFQYKYEYDVEANIKRRIDTEYVGTPKINQLKIDLEEHDDVGRLIIYAAFQGSIDIITQTCIEAGWAVLQCDGRGMNVYNSVYDVQFCLDQMDRSTNDGTIPKLAFVANPDSGGTGLELSASPTIIYYSNTNKGESRMQSEDRAHSNNMDKNRGLLIVDYCHLPIDAKIREQLIMKKDLQMLSMGAIKQLHLDLEV